MKRYTYSLHYDSGVDTYTHVYHNLSELLSVVNRCAPNAHMLTVDKIEKL